MINKKIMTNGEVERILSALCFADAALRKDDKKYEALKSTEIPEETKLAILRLHGQFHIEYENRSLQDE